MNKSSLVKWWRRRKTNIQVAIITGISLILATLVGLVWSYLFRDHHYKEEIRIEAVSKIKINDKTGIDIIVKNQSADFQNSTSLNLKITRHYFHPVAVIGSSVYSVNENLEIKIISDSTTKSVNYLANFTLNIRCSGLVSLVFNLPIREEFESQKTKRIIIQFPDTINLYVREYCLALMGRYLIGNPPTKFELMNFLKGGELDLEAQLISSVGKAKIKTPMTFN